MTILDANDIVIEIGNIIKITYNTGLDCMCEVLNIHDSILGMVIWVRTIDTRMRFYTIHGRASEHIEIIKDPIKFIKAIPL